MGAQGDAESMRASKKITAVLSSFILSILPFLILWAAWSALPDTIPAHFIKIDCQSSLPIYASPEKLRCEPETAIDRPGAPGRCPRAGISLPVSKRMPSGTTNSRVLRPVRAAPEPRAGTHAADGRGIQPRPSRSRPRDGAPSPRKISTAPYRPGLI